MGKLIKTGGGLGAPPSGLIPIGDSGFYKTPDVVDPRDCEFYPDSPYCGGNPLTKDIIKLDIDIGIDGCSVHASVTPSLGFMKLPTHTLAYVKEDCRKEYEARTNDPPPVPPPDLPEEWKDVRPQWVPPGFDPKDFIVAATGLNLYSFSRDYRGNTSFTACSSWDGVQSISDLIAPSPQGYNYEPATALCSGQGKGVFTNTSPDSESVSGELIYDFRMHPKTPPQSQGYIALAETILFHGVFLALYRGRLGDIFPSMRLPFSSGSNFNSQGFGTMLVKQTYLAFLERIDPGKNGEPPDYIPQPNNRFKRHPPPPPRPKCCMSCCTPSQQRQDNNDALLRQILKNQQKIMNALGTYPFNVTLFDADDNKVGAQSKNVAVANIAKGQKLMIEREEKNAKTLGIDQFPVYAPSSIVEDESNGLLGDIGDLKNKIFKQKIDSLAELLNWKIRNDYEIFGRWQEVIEVEGEDGRQKRVVLPNMSKVFKELIGLNTTQIRIVSYIFDTMLKMYIDVANTKISAATTEAMMRDIQDFLDYPTEEKLLEVPIGISIPSKGMNPDDMEDLKRFLKDSKAKTKYDDWTGEGSLHDLLIVLLDAASMIRAVFYQKG